MGIYYQLIVDNRPIISEQYEVDPLIMTIFRESDKRVYQRRHSEVTGWFSNGEDDELETAYVYANTVSNIKKRLDIMGFSLANIEIEFTKVIYEHFENLRENRPRRPDLLGAEELKKTTLTDWIDAYAIIQQQNIWKVEDLPENRSPEAHHLITEGFESFPCNDFRSWLRVYLEACPDEQSLVYLDITYLVANGFYYPDDAVCELAIRKLNTEYSINEKIVVLTEGSTDSTILDKSLKLLYPHLVGYYSFMDFGASNASGGASSLVSNVKAFIGAGFSNRIIAYFDNDTAAHVVLKSMQGIVVPHNVRILHYPNLDFAKSYPTLGPSGISECDINGLACSIELYLGLDVIKANGVFTPIQWKGYDNSLKQYQGEILDKKHLYDAFDEKYRRCIKNRELIESTDWEPLKLVLEKAFREFS